jgi:two-component system, NtrC family, sensor kinase
MPGGPTNRRAFMAVLGGALAWPLVARAQQQGDRVRALQIRILHMQAEVIAAMIGQFIREIEAQVGWTTQLPWSASTFEHHRFDASRLLRQVPAINELSQLDATGHEQMRVSRLTMDTIGTQTDYSKDPKFTEAVAHKVYYGPVYFPRPVGPPGGPQVPGEPCMTLSVAGRRGDAGVSVAEVGLKLIQDAVTKLKVGENGVAYVLDAQGRVIAHPDVSLVTADFSGLAQVQATRGAGSGAPPQSLPAVKDINGHDVLAAYAPVAPLGWLVFVELPVEEAQ